MTPSRPLPVLKLMIVLAISLVGFIVYGTLAERSAAAEANKFCNALRIGGPLGDLESRAKAAGAYPRLTHWNRPASGTPWFEATFTGASSMSRHICWIEGTSAIESIKYVYLD